jgi:hypothetical protein
MKSLMKHTRNRIRLPLSRSSMRERAKAVAAYYGTLLFAAGIAVWLITVMIVSPVLAAISIPTDVPYTQDFDSIGATATATLPTDWRADKQATVRTVGSYATAVTATERVGGANLATNAANGIYNFGSGTTATGGADRAVGFLSSGAATQSGNLYAQFINSTGADILNFMVSYDVEKYRNGSNAAGFSIQMYYSFDGVNWTNGGAGFLTSFPADANNNGFATAPGATVSVSSSLSIVIPSGSNFYLAWNYSVTSGTTTTNAQALAIDNVSVIGTGPSAVKLVSFNATSYKGGQVLLEWRTGFEVHNLGFNIYREQAGLRRRITPQMVAGSALMVGAQTNLMSGRSYEWTDSASNEKGVQYWLEAIDLNGQSVWHGPFAVSRSLPDETLPPLRRRATLLSNLGRSDVQQGSTHTVERAANTIQATAAQFAAQSDLAARPAIKMSVRQEGWYRVTQPELVAAGLDSKFDPRNFQLFAEGQEQPLMVRGEDDGRFDSADSIEFYGLGLDTLSTDARVYWLVPSAQAGRRIKAGKGRGSRGASESFAYTVEREDKTVYFSSLRNGEKENFFGAVIARDPVDQALFLPHVNRASTVDATLEVTLQGVTAPSHIVRVQFNGRELGEISFLSQARGVAKYSVPHAALQEGQNRVTLIRQESDSDVSLVESIRLTYQHTYTADDNALRFTASSKQRVTIDGFSSASIRVMDVTDSSDAREVRTEVQQRGDNYAVIVSVPKGGQRVLLAFSDDWVKRPAQIIYDQPSDLRDKGQRADLVIITRRDFFASIEPLKQLRQSQGLSVTLVDVEDIYDEFNYGEKSPAALKNFLAYAKESWSKAPRFVMLVGDASYDSRNYLGSEDGDIIPTKLIDTVIMETASDDWLADFNGDSLAEMALGRLPARTSHEAAAMIEKIISYNPASIDGVLLVSDSNNDGIDFEGDSSRLRQLVPSNLSIEAINRGQMSDAAAKGIVLDRIKRGQKIINYFGHGSVDVWRGELLTSADARELSGGDGLSVLFSITCLNGYFHDAAVESLAESLIKVERGGAVAVWSSSGMCGASEQARMNQEMFRLIFNDGSNAEALTLGEETLKAKKFIGDIDTRQTYILFGDPTMKLR